MTEYRHFMVESRGPIGCVVPLPSDFDVDRRNFIMGAANNENA